MARSLGSEGASGGGDGREAGFRDSLRGTVADWQRRLAGARTLSDEAPSIGSEAGGLGDLAQSRGWSALAANLHYIARLSRDAPHDLADALGMLARGLAGRNESGAASMGMTFRMDPAPSRAPPASGPGSIAPPPMLDASSVGPPVRAAVRPPGAPAAAAQSPSLRSPLPTFESRGAEDKRSLAPVESSAAPLPASIPKAAAPPQLLVKNMLGFKGFGRKESASEPPAPQGRDRPLLGFGGVGAGVRPSSPVPRRPSSQPSGDRPEPFAPPRRSSRPSQRRSGSPAQPPVRRQGSGVPVWFYVLGAMVALLAATIVILVIALGRHVRNSEPLAAIDAVAASASVPPMARPSAIDEVADVVHKRNRGREETPEMRALIDAQSRLLSLCREDAAKCEGSRWTPNSREVLAPIDAGSFVPAPTGGPLSAWLQRLKKPRDFPLADDPVLRQAFDYHTKNIHGRQSFQTELFNCAAYADIFDSTILKYGAPGWLSAVVYQESGCNPSATSPVGAKGLWQFMPESARAYGLRVVDDEVDERLNPIKSTDAAIHFLTDLQRKLGAWDLALAAYNMGPFGLIVRLAQLGENAGFWDLARADLLPEETTGYVPAIEAYALIVENLGRLQFSRDGKRLESTAELIVKPGTRLSLVARAASTTTVHIRELNPEFLRDTVPEGETTARVPDAEAHRGKSFLETLSPDDNRDLCVPDNFDWGARPFETSPYAKGCGESGPNR